MWRASENVFSFVSYVMEQECEWIKQNFLSKIATLFDPLGSLVLFLVRAKMLMQEVWIHGLDLEERLSQKLFAKVTK